jgi:predicted PurR-regulated permease PerM
MGASTFSPVSLWRYPRPSGSSETVYAFGHNNMTRNRAALVFLLGLTIVALYLCYLLIAPFYKPVIFSIVLAVLFYPMHAYVGRWIQNRNIAAVLSTTLVVLLITSLSLFLGQALVSGLRDVYQSLSESGESKERLAVFIVQLSDRAIAVASRYIPIPVSDVQNSILNQAEKAVAGLITMSAGAVGSLTSLALDGLIAFFVLFFLFRDGRSMLRRGSVILPLKTDQVRRLLKCVKDTLNAIAYGTIAMAAIQGTLTGLAFWFLGITSPVAWGIVTTLCALLPIIGTAFVLFPATCMLIFSGHWIKGLILLVWAVAVVHPVDNVLRPYLIGERVKLSTLYVFFALLGGLKTFGGLGVFIGPLILALTVALFRFLREEERAGNWSFQEHFESATSPQHRA